MFHLERDASKVALFHLLQRAQELGFELVDCQLPNNHLLSLGAIQIPRVDFLQRLVKGGVLPSTSQTVSSIELTT
jgi:leucyl/phenylalanyl-tRNA--protein transferase